jgi:hypothetical protein
MLNVLTPIYFLQKGQYFNFAYLPKIIPPVDLREFLMLPAPALRIRGEHHRTENIINFMRTIRIPKSHTGMFFYFNRERAFNAYDADYQTSYLR